jgi:hypothetical protein
MVEDPELKFDNRSPVDLKDRFRTYFNDSYRQLYPNAKTHLSHTTIRGVNPDGSSLFDKMRSRKRKPFTAEEDAALKQGYEKHGTSWATIVKDPVFQVQNRRSTDLRDRFRNAFPDLYISAGYKPRPPQKAGSLPKPAKRRKGSDGDLPPPKQWRRNRAATMGGFPDARNALSDGELSSGEEDGPPPAATPNCDVSSPPTTPIELEPRTSGHKSPARSWSQSHIGSPALSTSEYFPPTLRTLNMIPKSGWGPQDWLSSNPRMGSANQISSLSISTSSGPPSSFSQSRSHSYSLSQSHAIFDRYDLSSAGHLSPSYDFAHSEAGGYGGDDSAFSDVDMYASSGFRGFTHHSNTAGDLIFGTRSQGGYSGYGHGATSFLPQDGTINPMQLHAIDERVESIRLDDRPITHSGIPTSATSPAALKTNNIAADIHPPMLPPPTLPSRNCDDHMLEKFSAAIPTTPDEHEVATTPTIPNHPGHLSTNPVAPSAFHRFTNYLQRSMSQPPTSLSNFDALHHRSAASDTQLAASAPYSSFPDPFSSLPSSHLGVLSDDIPFLDMHYWGSSNHPNDLYGQHSLVDHSTGALDLARSPAIRPRSKSPPFKKTTSPLLTNMSQSTKVSTSPSSRRPTHQHQRVQSAVTSLDFQLTTRNDNKRKRVSWDGGK